MTPFPTPALSEAFERIFDGEQCAREEIAEAFSLMRRLPAARIAVPCVEPSGAGIRVADVSLSTAIRDMVTDGDGEAELLAILQASDCPLVQRLREVLCARWQKLWAADVAEARQ